MEKRYSTMTIFSIFLFSFLITKHGMAHSIELLTYSGKYTLNYNCRPTGCPKKVNHYQIIKQKIVLNRIKARQ